MNIHKIVLIIYIVIKELIMNEFELILLSLYLELIDISSSKDIKPINSFLNRKYQRFEQNFNLWIIL